MGPLQADHAGAISDLPGKGGNTSPQVWDAPSHMDLQCMYSPTETCASQTPKVTMSREEQ